jgi:DNA repair exonuclease SbcCD nuclease subunit
VKNRVKSAVKFVSNFEQTCAETAIAFNYQYVICGHIHHPEIRPIQTLKGQVTYLNSGDWIENLTALEYYAGEWHLYKYYEDGQKHLSITEDYNPEELDNTKILQKLVNELKSKSA